MNYSAIPSNYSNYLTNSQIVRTGEVYMAERKLEHLNCIIEKNQSQGALYLGDVVCLLKQELLNKHDIRVILTCMVEPVTNIDKRILMHKRIPIHDAINYPISNHFQEAIQYIDQARKQGHNILVHCHAGVSRSATIVCAYLMVQKNWSHLQALDFLRTKRYRAKPNQNFLRQLQLFNLSKKTFMNKQPQTSHLKKIQKIVLESEIQVHEELLHLEQKLKSKQQNKNKKHTFLTNQMKIYQRQGKEEKFSNLKKQTPKTQKCHLNNIFKSNFENNSIASFTGVKAPSKNNFFSVSQTNNRYSLSHNYPNNYRMYEQKYKNQEQRQKEQQQKQFESTNRELILSTPKKVQQVLKNDRTEANSYYRHTAPNVHLFHSKVKPCAQQYKWTQHKKQHKNQFANNFDNINEVRPFNLFQSLHPELEKNSILT